MSVCRLVCRFIYPSISLCFIIYLSVCMWVSLSVYLSNRLSLWFTLFIFCVSFSVHLSNRLPGLFFSFDCLCVPLSLSIHVFIRLAFLSIYWSSIPLSIFHSCIFLSVCKSFVCISVFKSLYTCVNITYQSLQTKQNIFTFNRPFV